MKRTLILLLALALLWGCGAPSVPTETPSTDATTEDFTGPLTLLVEDGCVEDSSDWALFYYSSQGDLLSNEAYNTIEITQRYAPNDLEPELREFHSTLTWDGEVFTLTEEEGTFTFKYLVYSANMMPPQSHYDYAEYFLLSDDPEMTAETYFNALYSSVALPGESIAPTRVIYSEYHEFQRAETWGQAPAEAREWLEVEFWQEGGVLVSNFYYQADALPARWGESIFAPTAADRLPEETYNMALLETEEGYILFRRHNFAFWELQNPVFSYCPSYCEIIATGYDADGAPIWQATTPIFVD